MPLREVVNASRYREWLASKFAYVSGGTLLGLGAADVPVSVGLVGWSTGLVWAAALLAFGYVWNDHCDRAADRRAGRWVRDGQVLRTASMVWAAAMIGSGAMLVLAVSTAWTLALVVTATVLAWAYSAPAVRLKERGLAGVVAGAVSQRSLPLLVLLHVVEAPPVLTAGLFTFATAWGVRCMVAHQVLDAANDSTAGVDTWVRRHPARASGLLRVVAVCELAAATVAGGSLVATGGPGAAWSTGIAVAVAVAVGVRLKRQARRRQDRASRWLGFATPPLISLHAVALPAAAWPLVIIADPLWAIAVVLDLIARASELVGVLDHFVDRPDLEGGEAVSSW